jgi:hypothetical protein
MSAAERFTGPVLSNLGTASAYPGHEYTRRMNLVRHTIYDVRTAWRDPAQYERIKEQVREALSIDRYPAEVRSKVEYLLRSFHNYADIDRGPIKGTEGDDWTALELYCSEEGYEYLYKTIYTILRTEDVDQKTLLMAVVLVEYLTIELYNLRLENIGDTRYANFQGITYRGMGVTPTAVADFRKIAEHRDLTQRNFAIPLGFMSSSIDYEQMRRFSDRITSEHKMYWTIHIYGLDRNLMSWYKQKYQDSVVTSICAMPVARISEYSEKEVLLRGPFFHVIRMRSESCGEQHIHHLELVMLNTNRDHGTELGSNEGEKGIQRRFFANIIVASRYEICASLAEPYSHEEAEQYRGLAREAFQNLKASNSVQMEPDDELAHARSEAEATWLGSSLFRSYPRNYATRRLRWQRAVAAGMWDEVEEILHSEYDWRRSDWYNVYPLVGKLNRLLRNRKVLVRVTVSRRRRIIENHLHVTT